MPLEVRELVVRARVGTKGDQDHQSDSSTEGQDRSVSYAEAVREALAQMNEINRNRKER